MTQVKTVNGVQVISNGAGVQVIGSNAPNQEGLSPRELLESAVALCVMISVKKVLERDQMAYDPAGIEVDVSAVKEGDVTNRFTNLHVRVKLPDSLDEAYRNKLITIAERACTIGNTLQHGAVVETVEV